jgi:hypothetical protein
VYRIPRSQRTRSGAVEAGERIGEVREKKLEGIS